MLFAWSMCADRVRSTGVGPRSDRWRPWSGCALAGALALAPLACGAAPSPANAAALLPSRLPQAPGVELVIDGSGGDPKGTIDRLEQAGYAVAVALPPNVYYVRPRHTARALPAGLIAAIPGSVTDSGAPPNGAEPTEFTPNLFGQTDVLPPLHPQGVPRRGGSIGLHYGTRWEDTSEFLYGRVAVSILFPESDGTIDVNRYNWTPTLRDSMVRSTVTGLLRWSGRAAARGIPLTFVIEVRADLPTRYEPIDHPVSEEGLWIADVLEPLVGSKGNITDLAYAYANGARARLGTQWATIVFAIQNDTDPDGAFPDGNIGYAHLGGPWFVLPINNLNTSARLDFYVEHEMTHLFWALDEFPANNAWWGCDLTTGYFGQPNSNSEIPAAGYCGLNTQCIMRGNYPGIVCPATEAQVGWADLDASGVIDLQETRPAVRPDSARVHVPSGAQVTMRGIAADVALPNKNPYHFFAGDSISVATIDSIFYRLDGGPWGSLPALDGSFDAGEERFALTLGPFAPGSHKAEWQAKNSNGRMLAVPESTAILVAPAAGAGEPPGSGARPPQGIALRAGPVPSRGAVRFALSGARGARGEARLYDAQGRLVRSWLLQLPASGSFEWSWDPRDHGGAATASGLYFLTVEVGRARESRRLVLLH